MRRIITPSPAALGFRRGPSLAGEWRTLDAGNQGQAFSDGASTDQGTDRGEKGDQLWKKFYSQ
jgi:hypothetical protein